MCHLRYWHKDVSSPTMFAPESACKMYADNACCTAETALKCAPRPLPSLLLSSGVRT